MFKLFQNLLPGETEAQQSNLEVYGANLNTAASWQDKLTQADILWEQGKLNEALAIYSLAIEQNPKSVEIENRIAARLKQQGDLATAYEKLATGLKNNGYIEQAANYYRQAIHIKSLTGNTKEQLLRSSVQKHQRTPIPLASLKEAAFSFQPLTNVNSALVKVPQPQATIGEVEVEARNDNTSPTFLQNMKTANPQQAKDIDWETAQVYLQKALEHSEKQEWKKSALACKQATAILPAMAEAYKVWGNALQRMGKTGEAMACYAKAIEIKPNLAEVYAGIAEIYGQQEKWHQAIKHYQKATIIRPSVEIYRGLADAWQRLGETDKANLNLYRASELESSLSSKASDKNPVETLSSNPSIEEYCRLAQKLEQQNRWQQAAIYYRQALDLSLAQPALPPAASRPQLQSASPQPDSARNLSITQEKASQSQLDRAISRYHKQSRLQPNSPKIHTDLGNLYGRKGKWQHAIACYRKAIYLNPRYAKAHLNLARTLLRINKQKEFVKEMQLAFELEPKIGSAMDRFYLGNALADRGKMQEAISFYYKAIVLNPNFVQSYHRLSEILSKQGKHQEAMEFLKQGIENNPRNPESFYFLGQQLELLGHWEGAVKIYSRVLQIEPQFPGASQKLNHALAEKLKSNYRR